MTRNCLIIIDMQNDFLDRLGDDSRTELIHNTNQLIDLFRASDCLASHDPEHGRISIAYMDRNIAVAMTNDQISDEMM